MMTVVILNDSDRPVRVLKLHSLINYFISVENKNEFS